LLVLSRVRNLTPILPTADIAGTLAWYKSALGATSDWLYGDPPNHGGCMLGAASIHFGLDPDLAQAMAGFSIFVQLFDIEAFRQKLRDLGTPVVEELETKPWNAIEFVVVDPSGVRLRFTEFGKVPEAKPHVDAELEIRQLTPAENKSLMVAIGWDNENSGRDGSHPERLFTVVAKVGDEVVGAASVVGNGVEAFHVRDVMVRPEYQGSGIGSQMMGELVAWLHREVPQGQHVTLLTGTRNMSFYEKFGFQGPDSEWVGMYLRV